MTERKEKKIKKQKLIEEKKKKKTKKGFHPRGLRVQILHVKK